jgi:hypothetical protein
MRTTISSGWLLHTASLLALALMGGLTAPVRAGGWDPVEDASCDRVSQSVDANAAPVLEALERQARQRFGRSFADLNPEQMVQLSMSIQVQGGQMTEGQQRMQDRCTAYQQRVMAKESAAAGFRSLFTAQALLDRWGRESVAGLGCSCPDFRPAGEDVDHGCSALPLCPGQQGGARIPDLERGCRSIGAAAWIRRQLPEFYRTLGFPPEIEEVRDVSASLDRPLPSAGCAQLPAPSAPPLIAAANAPGPAAPGAIAAAAACFVSPAPASCQEALVRGDGLAVVAQRAGRDRCLGYALTARTLWALGADPRFTDLLIRFPEAARLRNEARIALRYLRMDCKGL